MVKHVAAGKSRAGVLVQTVEADAARALARACGHAWKLANLFLREPRRSRSDSRSSNVRNLFSNDAILLRQMCNDATLMSGRVFQDGHRLLCHSGMRRAASHHVQNFE